MSFSLVVLSKGHNGDIEALKDIFDDKNILIVTTRNKQYYANIKAKSVDFIVVSTYESLLADLEKAKHYDLVIVDNFSVFAKNMLNHSLENTKDASIKTAGGTPTKLAWLSVSLTVTSFVAVLKGLADSHVFFVDIKNTNGELKPDINIYIYQYLLGIASGIWYVYQYVSEDGSFVTGIQKDSQKSKYFITED